MITNIMHRAKDRVIQANMTIIDAMKKMDTIDKKSLLVFDKDRFINIVTIGDIQRAIINDQPMTAQVGTVLRAQTRVCHSDESVDEIKSQMLKYRIELMPVLDAGENLVDIFFWEDLFASNYQPTNVVLGLPVVIMAGGKGTRLWPITQVIPKALIPLGDKSILERIMDNFRKVGCDTFFISINFKGDFIRFYLNQLPSSSGNISFIQEEVPLGTAGSLHLLKSRITTPFFLTNCDIIVEEQYEQIFNYHTLEKNELTLVAALKHYEIPYGTVESTSHGELVHLAEKPEITFKINTGFYLIEPHLLDEIPENKFFHITHLIEKIKARDGRVGVFPISERSWQDIGEWKEYLGNNKITL
jgi:dTDP-glucose pyrophosphorylase/CBS domain-containing protein